MRATPEDLARLDDRIAEAEASVAALKQLRKILAARCGEGPPAKSRKADESNKQTAERIATHVARGPLTVSQLSRKLGVDPRALGRIVNQSARFKRDKDNRVMLADGKTG